MPSSSDRGASVPLTDAMCLHVLLVPAVDDRTQGRQFIVNKQRAGQTGDNWNRGTYGRRQDVKPLYEKEKYIDQHKIDMQAGVAERAKNLTSNGFRYPSPNKLSSGLGAYWGVIGSKHEHMPDFAVVQKGAKPGPVVHESRQMVTNPPKKGYGASTPGCIFGPGPLKDEVGYGKYGGREYAWNPDPYDSARQAEISERKKGSEALQGRPPFSSASKSLDFFDGHKRVASSAVYTEDPRVPERPKPKSEFAPVADRPFYPARGPRSGWQGAMNKFPVYLPDPLEEKMKLAKQEAEAAKNVGAAPFKPTSKPFTTPQPSIVFKTFGPQPMS